MESPFTPSTSPFSVPPADPPRSTLRPALIKLFPFLGDAVLVGVLLHFVASGFKGPLLLPALAGAILGYLIAQTTAKRKIRSKTGLLLLTICCGLLCYGTRLVADIVQAREELIQATAMVCSGGNPQVKARLEKQLRGQITPLGYVPTFLKTAAAKGTAIQGSRRTYSFWGMRYRKLDDHPLTFTTTSFYVVLGTEPLFLIGAASAVVWLLSARPICEKCDAEREEKTTILNLYDDQIASALELLSRGEFAALTQFIMEDVQEGSRDRRTATLRLSKCPSCAGGQADLVQTRDRRFETLWESQVTPQEVIRLQETREKFLEMAEAVANRDSLTADSTLWENFMSIPFFYASEGSTLFKVYVGEAALYGAKIGAGVYDSRTVHFDVAPYGCIIALLLHIPVLRKVLAKRAALEAEIDVLIPGSPAFLSRDQENFCILTEEIESATFEPSSVSKVFVSDAHMTLKLRSGEKRRFYFIELQAPEPIEVMLRSRLLKI